MLVLHAHEILLKIERTPKIFVAAIGGNALGGGLEITLACDLRFAAEGEYRLGLPEASLRVLPGNGGTQRLQRLIGRTRALDMMLTATSVGPQRALELGIVDRLFPADRLVEESVAYVARLAKARRWHWATSKSRPGSAPTCHWRALWHWNVKRSPVYSRPKMAQRGSPRLRERRRSGRVASQVARRSPSHRRFRT